MGNPLFLVFGFAMFIIGTAVGNLANDNGIQHKSLTKAFIPLVDAKIVDHSWDDVKLVRLCHDYGIYLLPNDTYRIARFRGVPFGSVVIDPDKVC